MSTSAAEEYPRNSYDAFTEAIASERGDAPPERKVSPKSPDDAGGRNNYFASRAGTMRKAGFDPDAILAALRTENASRGYDLPDRELATIARSIGSYEIGDSGGSSADLEGNVRHGLINHGVRIDAVGRFREVGTGAIARDLTPGLLVDLIWNDLRKLKKVSAEDIGRVLNIEFYAAKRREYDKIAGRFLGKPERAEGLEELRRFIVAIAGVADPAVVGGFLQFMWCVKRSLAGLPREHDIMPILYNQVQGNGKSTAVRRLVSPLAELVDSVTVETLADERKRADLGRFVVGVWDEMEGADKRDTDAIKNALSSQDVSYRPMRTNDNLTLTRTMNFIGTSNKPLAAMVRDSSGNRRFVEILTTLRIEHDVVNGIDYPLLWQAVSEHAEAPAKAVLGEIRAHQAVGRFQDSVSLWLEAQDFTEAHVGFDELRDSYVDWCKRFDDSSLSPAMFGPRLVAEGFSKVKAVRDGGKRAMVWVVPERLLATSTHPTPGRPGVTSTPPSRQNSSQDNIFMINVQGVHPQSDVRGKIDSRETKNTLDTLDVHGRNVESALTTEWPTPPGGGELWVYDCEVFPNRFMFSAWNGSEWMEFDETSLGKLATWLKDKTKVLAGFNSHGYDDVIVGSLIHDARNRTPGHIYRLSSMIVEPKDQAARDAVFKERYKHRPWSYSIDVFQLLNAKGALKEHECRIGFPTIAESPAPFDKPLPAEMVDAVRKYCRNDVMATAQILLDRWSLVTLRETLAEQFDLGNRAYVLSEQGLAQTTFLTLHRKRTGETSGKVREAAAKVPANGQDNFPMAEIISDRVRFTTEPFNAALASLRAGTLVKEESWSIDVPGKDLAEPFALAGCAVSIGVGGLHTVDAPGVFEATPETAIVDLDVTSYYPSLMINERIYPPQLGESFLANLADLRDRRVKAKKAGDKTTADALKIVLNATFGKLNDKWSPIRSVDNAFRVTINGQLFLLMLLEALNGAGFEILSANTDGVTIRAARARLETDLAGVTAAWEATTGLTLERTLFAKVCRRDVNTYLAVSEDGGKVKSKGEFNPESGKGDGRVICTAATAHLLEGVDPAASVAAETDPLAFLFYQRVKNGGDLYHGEDKVGKTARWYASTDGAAIRRKNPDGTFATIPNGHRATSATDVTGWTIDNLANVDRPHYVSAAWDLIREVVKR